MASDPSTYKTGNSVPSNQPQDVSDNARVFDVFTNDQANEQVVTRTGETIDTLYGIHVKADNIVKTASDQIDLAIAAAGRKSIGAYDANPAPQFTTLNQYVTYQGKEYAVLELADLPYTVQAGVYPDPDDDPKLKQTGEVTKALLFSVAPMPWIPTAISGVNSTKNQPYEYIDADGNRTTVYDPVGNNVMGAEPDDNFVVSPAGVNQAVSEPSEIKDLPESFAMGKYVFIRDASRDAVSATPFYIENDSITVKDSADLAYTAKATGGIDLSPFGLVYDSRGETAAPGTDNQALLQSIINSAKAKPVGLSGEFTGSKIEFGFGGLYLSDGLDLTNNASVSMSGLGKTKTNIFISSTAPSGSVFNLTGSTNNRSAFQDLRITTVGGSEGVISNVDAFSSTGGSNQIDIIGGWVNNLGSVYSGVASDSNFKDITAEYCKQFVDIDGGGSRDLDISENVIYNCGFIGGGSSPQPSIVQIKDAENITLARNRIVNDTAPSPTPNGVFYLVNVLNFVIRDQMFFERCNYVGPYINIDGGYGVIKDVFIPRTKGDSTALVAQNCTRLFVGGVHIDSESSPQNNGGAKFDSIQSLIIDSLTVGTTGLVNLLLRDCGSVVINTLVLSGTSLSASYDEALRIEGCGSVQIGSIVIANRSQGAHDILIGDSPSGNKTGVVTIGSVKGTVQSRISNSALNSSIPVVFA